MRCTGVTYFLPYWQIRLEIKRGTLAELRLADQSNDYSASADDEEYEEDETDDAFFLSAAGKACHDRVRVSLLPAIPDLSNHYTAQFEAIFDPRSVGDIKLPGQFFAVAVQPLRRRWCRSAQGLGHRIP